MIAAEAHRPLEKLRRKLEETFGQFDLAQTASPRSDRAEEHLIATLSNGIKQRRLVEIEYVKVGEDTAITHVVEPYWLERQLPHWYVHTWDRTRDGVRSFRLDRMRSATRTSADRFEPREGFELDHLRDARVARILYSKNVARWEVERGAQLAPRRDGDRRAEGRQPRVARRRDPPLPRRSRSARACRSTPESRSPIARAAHRARPRSPPRQGLRPP